MGRRGGTVGHRGRDAAGRGTEGVANREIGVPGVGRRSGRWTLRRIRRMKPGHRQRMPAMVESNAQPLSQEVFMEPEFPPSPPRFRPFVFP